MTLAGLQALLDQLSFLLDTYNTLDRLSAF